MEWSISGILWTYTEGQEIKDFEILAGDWLKWYIMGCQGLKKEQEEEYGKRGHSKETKDLGNEWIREQKGYEVIIGGGYTGV